MFVWFRIAGAPEYSRSERRTPQRLQKFLSQR